VIYYALEISQELAYLRAAYGLAGLTENDMFDAPEVFKQKIKSAIKENIAGNLLIKHFPIGTAKISDLEAHTRMVKKKLNINPKMIVIDYADTVAISDPTQPRDIQQAQVYKDAIAFGKRQGACILMPDRCTADAVERKVPNLKSFQGAYSKGGIVDIALGLCATETEYQENVLRTFCFINRHGPAWQHWRGKVEPEKAIVNIGDIIPYVPEEEGEDKRYKRSSPSVPSELT
jgi:hypothetical protein